MFRVGQRRRPVLRIAEPQGAHVLQQRRFAQDPPEQAGRERRQGMVLQHAAAEPIDHGDGAAAGGLYQPGNAGHAAARQMQRVHQVPGLLADDQIDPLQPVESLEIEIVVADGEIAALDGRVAQIAREVGVAEVGRALRSRAEQHDPAVVAPAQRLETLLQAEEIAGEPLGVAVAEETRRGRG